MRDEEKYLMMRGIGWHKNGWWDRKAWWYVGNTAAVPRLDIPSLNMQDASAGFSPLWSEVIGTMTSWPSLLSLAATWDPNVVRTYSRALAGEFLHKGVNVILGPSINVHRVARGGRNFEYLSGEDPYLGARLAEAYVQGVQSQGVMAVAKHWIFNEQETHRDSESSVVDEKTAWELYYPPFWSAVEAGVSAVMCSYNRIDGEYSCENAEQLGLLREKLGFRGFVQSDWWATHSTSVSQGLDQDMPGIGDYGPGMGFPNTSTWFDPERLKRQRSEDVDRSVRRILASIYRIRLANPCRPPGCGHWYRRNVTAPAHVALARSVAAESVVLLRNEGLLPLAASEELRTIAVIGAAAAAQSFDPHGEGQGGKLWWQGDYYSGGGSGHVPAKPAGVVTALDGIRRRAARDGIEVLSSPTNNIKGAMRVARRADVAIVVAGSTSGESRDRESLALDGNADHLIAAVAKQAKHVIVLLQVPGAVLMPWKLAVDAILVMFLGGQETGNAWGDVLFGDHAPSGRLPIMMPETEADTVSPSTGASVVYSEGLETSYRNKRFAAAFPFGHGLTYTTFEYKTPTVIEAEAFDVDGGRDLLGDDSSGSSGSGPRPVRAQKHINVCCPVRNTGGMAGKAVVQLYLELPPSAGHPAPLLKGFAKTSLLFPGDSETVTFKLTPRDLSYYDVDRGSWVMADEAVAHIGASSADIRQFMSLVNLRRPLFFQNTGAEDCGGAGAGATSAAAKAASLSRGAPRQSRVSNANSTLWRWLLLLVPAILLGLAVWAKRSGSRYPTCLSECAPCCFAPLPRHDSYSMDIRHDAMRGPTRGADERAAEAPGTLRDW
jgi:beta-glucosidase